jgi:hypothetical protein
MKWLFQNWYIAWGLICVVAVIVAYVPFRQKPGAPGARFFFFLFPPADPIRRRPSGLTPRAIVLWLIGFFIVVIATIFMPIVS